LTERQLYIGPSVCEVLLPIDVYYDHEWNNRHIASMAGGINSSRCDASTKPSAILSTPLSGVWLQTSCKSFDYITLPGRVLPEAISCWRATLGRTHPGSVFSRRHAPTREAGTS